MKNPFLELHREFARSGAKVLLCSGQACVLYGIAEFSKDGDWIIQESADDIEKVFEVLAKKGAVYRYGAPLDIRWLKLGWTSHFEYFTSERFRVRADFFSRPPRIDDLSLMWSRAVSWDDVSVIGIEELIKMKQTQRLKDYPIIGALAEVSGLTLNEPHLALAYLQDYGLLFQAVNRWPDDARRCSRDAVRLLCLGGDRSDVVNAIAQEQDLLTQQDRARIRSLENHSVEYRKLFSRTKKRWISDSIELVEQHETLLDIAQPLLSMGSSKPS